MEIANSPTVPDRLASLKKKHALQAVTLLFAIQMLTGSVHVPQPQHIGYFLTPTTAYQQELYAGITMTKTELPGPVVVHIAEIDLENPHLRISVTPGDPTGGKEARPQTVGEAVQADPVSLLAINANFFTPPYNLGPWQAITNFAGQVDILGFAMSNGIPVSSAEEWERNYVSVCVNRHNEVSIDYTCPADTYHAVSGNPLLVEEGKIAVGEGNLRHPRTAIALSRDGNTLWFVVVDGRQPGYSMGMTVHELAEYLVNELGAEVAVNMDGGGSSTFAIRLPNGAVKVFNRPIDALSLLGVRLIEIPGNMRPVATSIRVQIADAEMMLSNSEEKGTLSDK